MPIKIYGHDFKFMDIDGAACRFGLKDATGGVGAIFEGELTIDAPTLSLRLQLISKDNNTNTIEPPSVRTRIGTYRAVNIASASTLRVWVLVLGLTAALNNHAQLL